MNKLLTIPYIVVGGDLRKWHFKLVEMIKLRKEVFPAVSYRK